MASKVCYTTDFLDSLQTGEKISLLLVNNQLYEGIFFSIDALDFKYIVIANPKVLSNNEFKYLAEEFFKIQFDDVIYFKLSHKNIKQFSKGDFQTDVDISKKTTVGVVKRELIQFTVSQEEHLYFGNLDEETSKWDQFELNKQKFNVLTSYDEKHYTTELDHETIPRQVKQKAEKIVKEILEGDNSQNIHIREERGLVQQTDGNEDEEDKYSGVIRNQI